MIVAMVMAVIGLLHNGLWMALLFGMMALQQLATAAWTNTAGSDAPLIPQHLPLLMTLPPGLDDLLTLLRFPSVSTNS